MITKNTGASNFALNLCIIHTPPPPPLHSGKLFDIQFYASMILDLEQIIVITFLQKMSAIFKLIRYYLRGTNYRGY